MSNSRARPAERSFTHWLGRGLDSVPSVQTSSPSPPDSYADDPRYQRILLGIVMLAVTAFGTLMTLVTVSLGVMAEDLGTSRVTMTWAITGLMLTMAVFSPIAGTLGDLHGHRRVLLIGLAGGATATVLCAFAWDAASLIGLRVLFGIFTACVNPNAMALMMHAYGPSRRATAVGWFQFAVTGAPTLGLVVGGPLIDLVGWRAIFLAFGAVSALAFVVGSQAIRPMPRQQGRPLDVPGGVSLGVGVLLALLAITRVATIARESSFVDAMIDPGCLGLTVGAIIGFAVFVRVERTVASPMLRLDYLKRRTFTLPLLSGAAMQFAYMGGFVVTPALLGDRYGWTVGATALLMMPRPGMFSLASPLGGWLPSRIGLRTPIVLGALFMVASMIAFAVAAPLTNGLGIGLIVAGLTLSGLASGVSQPSIGALSVDSVADTDMGVANGMNQQITFVGIVSGIQTMNALIGDHPTAGQFVTSYLVGTVVAVVAVGLAWVIPAQRAS